jgi:hypothetical protein
MKMAKNVKRWFVDRVVAESWDGKGTGPNVRMDSKNMESLEEARAYIQKKIGEFASDKDVKLEWISWTTTTVEIKFNYRNEGVAKVHQTCVMSILEVGEDGRLAYVDIGD